ncbi:uncharacterized protein LOC143664358 [Tamandua tetradactyla]|uniref:uncharacterized protein LOC143664358 n=1 Tax=Tamandua tetradactyla TaxID=48850 RepID=UPI0040546511
MEGGGAVGGVREVFCRQPRARARRARYAPCTRPCARPAAPARLSESLSLPRSAPPPGAAATAACPRPGARPAGPALLALNQEDELEEDAWARPARSRVTAARAAAGAMERSRHRCCSSLERARLEPRRRQPPAAGPRVTRTAPGNVVRARGRAEESSVQ